MLQDDLAATLKEVIRLQEEVREMSNAQHTDKQKEERIQEKSNIPDALTTPGLGGRQQSCTKRVKHIEEFRRPKIPSSTFDGLTPWIDFKVHIEYCTELNGWNE